MNIPSTIYITDFKTDEIIATLENKEGESALFWSDTHEDNLENEEIFDFVMQADIPESEKVADLNRVVIPDEDGFYREFIIRDTEQFDGIKSVKTNASYSYLKKAKVIYPTERLGETVNTSLDYILSDTEWERGKTDYTSTHKVTYEEHINPLAALRKLASLFEVELFFRVEIKGNRIVRRFVDALKKGGQFKGKYIEVGKDLIGIRRIEQTSDIVTALVGLGPVKDDGTRHIVVERDKDALLRWGRKGKHLWDIYEPETDDTEMTEARLLTLTKMELKKRVNSVVQYEVEQVAIEYVFGYSHEKVRKGDIARIVDTTYSPSLYVEARVVDVKRSPSDPSQKTYILGDFIEYSEDEIMKKYEVLKRLLAKKISDSKATTIAREVSNQKALEIYEQTEKKIHTGELPPEDTTIKWLDTSPANPFPVFKVHDTAADDWVAATATEASDIGAETPAGAAEKANAVKTYTQNNALIKNVLYNGLKWSDTEGFIVERSDGLVRSVMNGTNGFKVQVRTTTLAPWKDIFYVDSAGNGKFAGDLTANKMVIGSETPESNPLMQDGSVGLGLKMPKVNAGLGSRSFIGNVYFKVGERNLEIYGGDTNGLPAIGVLDDIFLGARLNVSAISTESYRDAIMQNGWVQYGADNYPAQYQKDPMGKVHIRGRIKDGLSGAVAFTLPAGYRPSRKVRGTALGDWTNGQHSRYEVHPDGQVYVFFTGSAATEICLDDTKSFMAEQ
jgi:phage minor structural protein